MSKSPLPIQNPLAVRLLLDEPAVKTRFDNAISALKLASECGGELDQPQYASAHDGLIQLRDAALAADPTSSGRIG